MTDNHEDKIKSDKNADSLLKMIMQSKADYVSGNHKAARKAFSDIRKNLGRVTAKTGDQEKITTAPNDSR